MNYEIATNQPIPWSFIH